MRLSLPEAPSRTGLRQPQPLTPRERQILDLIWAGLKNGEIAHRLAISTKTVETHRATIMKKVRVSNTAQLLKAAIRDQLINYRKYPPSRSSVRRSDPRRAGTILQQQLVPRA